MKFDTNFHYDNEFNDYIAKKAEEIANGCRSQAEIRILSGCFKCGKILLDKDNLPKPGATLVYIQDDLIPTPCCEECYKELINDLS